MSTLNASIAAITARVDATAAQVTKGFPHFGDPVSGVWTTSPAGDWTGGYWNGMLWLVHARTGEQRYADLARRWTEALRPRIESETIFRGFLFYYGALLGHLLSSDADARAMAVAGAKAHASLYNPAARVIPLGSQAEEASNVGRGEANIDCVAGCGLLFWAARETAHAGLPDIGLAHALRHVELCVRDNGSVVQSASFDVGTGEVAGRYTHKRYSDDSTWARAQAWAMLGYAVCALWEPSEPAFLETAQRTADWWLAHVPGDGVSYWDFDAPVEEGTKRDTSSTSHRGGGTAQAGRPFARLSRLRPVPEGRRGDGAHPR